MKVDLCVVNFNTKNLVHRLINSLNADYAPDIWNLYIADNGSQDGSADMLIALQERHGFEFRENTNIGYSAACNQLAADGDAEIIGLLNADVWMNTKHVRAIVKNFQDNPDMAVLGPKQRDEAGYVTAGGIFGTNTHPRHRGWKHPDREDLLYKDRVEAVTVSGSALFTRRSVWDEMTRCPIYQQEYPQVAGAFLPTPHYYEETWYNYHVQAHGYKVIYDGSISIGHTWHAASPVGGSAEAYFAESQGIFRHMCDAHSIPRD